VLGSFAGAIDSVETEVAGAVEWWRSGDGEDGGGFPSLVAPLKDRIGECRWGMTAEGEPRT
jgi:hypothetical protein